MQQVVYDLRALSTPFPRATSATLEALFDNGRRETVTTNHAVEEYRRRFLGARVRLCFGRPDAHTPVATLVGVESFQHL